MSDTNDEHEVGYGKPPRHTRWKKGQSGNPSGRKKGSRGLKTDLDAELKSQLTIRLNGEQVKATTQQLMLRTLAARAASGDVAASRVLLNLVMQVFGAGDRGGERAKLSAQDQALLDDWLAQSGGSDSAPAGPGDREKPGEENDGS